MPARRSYRPKVEALEALRLLDAGLLPAILELAPPEVGTIPVAADTNPPGRDAATWDVALGQSEVGDLLARDSAPSLRMTAGAIALQTDAEAGAIRSGLDQLTRYLGRTWARAGIEPQFFEDCTQDVFETLLSQLGRDRFDHLAADIGHQGVTLMLNRDSADGPCFFRAVDMIKKRAQRVKNFQSLDEHYAEITSSAGTDGASASDWRHALDEAIDQALSPREAALIRETLKGRTPAEIAQAWGMAPKTISNEKTRALHKLRDCLAADLDA